MKVSVVIPTYNRAAYIRQAIDSVLCQSMTDFEVIVVDDGSTDSTGEILASYGDRIRQVRIPNGGPARARNAGMALARGRYIAWLDSDDRYHPAKLALQCAVLDADPGIALVYTECSAFDDHGLAKEFYLQTYHRSAYRRGGVTYDGLFENRTRLGDIDALRGCLPQRDAWTERFVYTGDIFNQYMLNTVVLASSIMFRSELLRSVAAQQPRFGLFHDLEFVLRLIRGRRVAFIDVPTYAIRFHGGQISTTMGPRAPRILIRKQQDLLRVLRVHGQRDAEYYRAHRAAVDRQIARLCRAVAVPMLGYDRGSPHQLRCFPRRARVYLRTAARHGFRHPMLEAASRLPLLPRRLLMRIERAWRSIRPV